MVKGKKFFLEKKKMKTACVHIYNSLNKGNKKTKIK